MASNSKKRRRVLGASCILAALIIASSSFAWFTSKDEVTNRLSASANYGVSIAENFQPPENWIPGQTINKDVSVVNTGNVDAFVRTWLTGEMKVLNTTPLLDNTASAYVTSAPTDPKANATTDENLKELNLTGYKTVSNVNYYYKQLSDTQTTNPETNGEQNQVDGYLYNGSRGTGTDATPNSSAYSEIQSVQAGGYLVAAPTSAEYEYVTDEATELPLYFDDTNKAVTTTVPRGTLVKVLNATNIASKTSGTIDATTKSVTLATANDTAVRGTSSVNTVYVQAQTTTFKPVNVDAETFAPYTSGTYIFARNVDLNSSDTAVTTDNLDDYEFAGYYFDAIEANGAKAGKGGYWALKNADADGTNRSDYTLPKKYAAKITDAGTLVYKGETDAADTNAVLTLVFDQSGDLSTVTPTDKLEMYTAAYKEIENSALEWVYDSGNGILSAIYQNGTTLDNTTDTTPTARNKKLRDDIVVDIKLANVVADSTNEKWKVVSQASGDNVNYYSYSNVGTNGTYNTSNAPAAALDKNRLWTFYYTNDVEEGDTTAKLVDSVTLRSTTQKEAFIAFDFDLNINMESAQITLGEDGNEKTTPVEAATGIWATTDAAKTGAYATAQDQTEIASIVWTGTAST